MAKYRLDEHTRSAYEHSVVPIGVYQALDGRVETLIVSDGLCELFGYGSRAEAMEKMDRDMYWNVHPDDVKRVSDVTSAFIREDAPYNLVCRVRTGSGYRLIHTRGRHIATETGQRLAVVWYIDEGDAGIDAVVARDEEKIEELKASMQSLLNNMPALTFSKNVENGRYLACNQMFAEYAKKRSPAEVVGLTDYDIFDKNTADHFVSDDKTALSMDRPYVLFEDAPDAAGNPRQFQTTKLKFIDETGRLCLLGMSMDITEVTRIRKEAEEAKSDKALRGAVIEALTRVYDSVWLLHDMETQRFELYRVDEKKSHLLPAQAASKLTKFSDAFAFYSNLVLEEDRQAFLDAVTPESIFRNTEGRLIYSVPFRRVFDSGIRYYRAEFARLEYGDNLSAIVLGFKDVDEEVRKEQQIQQTLREAMDRANASSKAKSDFLSSMSHDIRTPMNAIIGFTNLAIQNPGDRETVRDYLDKILASSNHLLSLINEVLEMSRIESGRIELDEAPCSLPEILHDLNTIIVGQVEAKQQELSMNAVNIANETVWCDRLRLNQVLLNLLSNAVKYTPAGGNISVGISQRPSGKPGRAWYEIRVRDNGIGMSREFAAKVFDAFTREKSSTVSGIQGTGLGMSITKSIVDLMGGTIRVETEKEKGSEFIVELELRVEAENSNRAVAELTGVRALVVDDDFNTCDSATGMLHQMGLRAEWTLSGREAVLRAKQAVERNDGFGVFLIDWKLPDLNGIETARQLSAAVGQDVPILMMTAYDWPTIRDEAAAAGVKGFCNKPLFPSELRAALTRVFGVTQETRKEEGADEQDFDFAGRRLLLVDDIEMNREIAVMLLEMNGFEVEQACDGTEAVEKVLNAQPGYYDAVLMDIQMPAMNGYEATQAIRASENPNAEIPIIAMTANAFDEDKKAALDAGMNGHVAKPIDIPTLLKVLSDVFRHSE